MKRRRRQEGGISISEDESVEQAAAASSPKPTPEVVVVAADDSMGPPGSSTPTPSPHQPTPPIDTLLALPMTARWTPLALKVRLWHNERRRTLSGDKRPKLADLPGFLATHPQYRVHHDETRVLQVLELGRDGIDGVHERNCAQCRSSDRAKSMITCRSCTYSWHPECLSKAPQPNTTTIVCDECLRRNPFSIIINHHNMMMQQRQSAEQALEATAPITVQVSKKFKGKPLDATKRKASRESNGGVSSQDGALEALPAIQPAAAAAPLDADKNNVFSRENFRLLFNFLSKLMDNGFISKHEQGLMKNLIIARDAQAVLMLSIVDIVEEGGDLNDAVDSLRRILLVS